ncbi:hypothetical protein GGX14DRAFT_654500 [Mycena pura]|uniref:F-box domain-containing protein n=1 Tax=Mycena pura TaxID=153505 RepID=A0AAD6VBJ0_9AGAR|nr:hypothetical protein GGX14DRAFT_654500 [Mycena pura]
MTELGEKRRVLRCGLRAAVFDFQICPALVPQIVLASQISTRTDAPSEGWEQPDKCPILTLPNEITSEIFLNFIPAYPSCPQLVGIDSESPGQLLRVCRQWRDVALSAAQLWRAIKICPKVNMKKQLGLMKTWLERSGSCPLAFDIHCGSAYDRHIFEIIETIFRHRSRWEYIKLHILSAFLLPNVGSLPLVRQVELGFSYDVKPYFTWNLNDAPQLLTATLWNFAYPSGFLPWHQLTSLTMVCKTPAECTPILKETPSLVHCRLILMLTKNEHNSDEPDTVLPRLESLTLESFMKEQMPATRYLGSFVVPSLRRLQVPDIFIQPDPVNKLSSFIALSGCQLHELCITGHLSGTEDAYRQGLSAIPILSFGAALMDGHFHGSGTCNTH